jgi:subtilase family serine protease
MKAYQAIVTAILLPVAVMQSAERQELHGHVPRGVANSRVLGRVSRSERLSLAIGLPLRNQEALELLLQQLYDPASPNYHQYQKPEQFAAQFGPTEPDYQALIQFANRTAWWSLERIRTAPYWTCPVPSGISNGSSI